MCVPNFKHNSSDLNTHKIELNAFKKRVNTSISVLKYNHICSKSRHTMLPETLCRPELGILVSTVRTMRNQAGQLQSNHIKFVIFIVSQAVFILRSSSHNWE